MLVFISGAVAATAAGSEGTTATVDNYPQYCNGMGTSGDACTATNWGGGDRRVNEGEPSGAEM